MAPTALRSLLSNSRKASVSEERSVDPLQTASPGQPMFQQQAAQNDDQRDQVCHAEHAKQSEGGQQAPHQEVRQESRLQRVLRTPPNDQRMQAVPAVELVVLQCVDNVEADQP